jgi:drug/metabolite transporter (DMT)-like permease
MPWRRNGLALMLASNVLFGLLPVTVKWANRGGYGAVQVTFFRFSVSLVGVALLAFAGPQRLRATNPRALWWRGFFGALAVLIYFVTVQLTTAAKATLLHYTYTIWANVYAVALGRSRPPKGFAPILLLALAGLWLVLGVGLDRFVWGDLSGVLSGMTAGGAVFAVKEARRTENALSTFGAFALVGWVFSGIALLAGPAVGFPALTGWTLMDGRGLGILMLMGLVSMAGQLLFTQGYGYTSLAMGTLLSLLVPVLAAVFGWLLLGEALGPGMLAGTALVLTACWMLSRREGRQEEIAAP